MPVPKTVAVASELDPISSLKANPDTRLRPEPLARAAGQALSAADFRLAARVRPATEAAGNSTPTDHFLAAHCWLVLSLAP